MPTKQKCFRLQDLLLFRQKWDVGRRKEKNLKWVDDSWNQGAPHLISRSPSCHLYSFSVLPASSASPWAQCTMRASPARPHRQCPSDTSCRPCVLIANFWERIADSCLPPPPPPPPLKTLVPFVSLVRIRLALGKGTELC